VILVAWDAARLWSRGSDEGLFYLGAIAGPVLLLAALSPPFLFPRYLLVPLLFLLIVLGRALATLFAASPAGRVAATALLLSFAGGNGVHLAAVVRERHGMHRSALTVIGASRSGPITVTSPSLDQWSALPLRFYSRRMGLEDRIRYVPRAESGRASAPVVDWLIEPAQPCTDAPPENFERPDGTRFMLRARYPVCGPSGMSWFLYAATP
jgi:hypothetical protein